MAKPHGHRLSSRAAPWDDAAVRRTYERLDRIIHEIGVGEVAVQLGCSKDLILAIQSRRRRVTSLTLAKRIEAVYGIPIGDWEPEPRLESFQRVV